MKELENNKQRIKTNYKKDKCINCNTIIVIRKNLKEKSCKKCISNNKRIESCKKIGGYKKIKGHKRELDFRKQYGDIKNMKIEYGATSDNIINNKSYICKILLEKLNVKNFNVSNKSGKNIQFTLGNIPELKDVDISNLENKEYIRNIFNIYLKKSTSNNPADILVYKDTINKKWIFFNIDDIIEYIVNNCMWRKLLSGRIKGDFNDNSKKGKRQYITYEYRTRHKSYFLGLNGGKGIEFIKLLISNKGIRHYIDDFNY
jgi:hypothetical protein